MITKCGWEDMRGEFKRVERGWCLGGEEFRRELLEQVDTRPGLSHFGEVAQEAEAVQAEQWVIEGLKRMGWSEADLRAPRKGEPRKVDLAWELRSQTMMPLAWIASRCTGEAVSVTRVNFSQAFIFDHGDDYGQHQELVFIGVNDHAENAANI